MNYVLKPHIKSTDDFTYEQHPEMSYLLHPELVLSKSFYSETDTTIVVHGWVISKDDLETTPKTYSHLWYFHVRGGKRRVRFDGVNDSRQTTKFNNVLLSSLIVPNIEPGFSAPTSTQIHFISHHLRTQIKHRYAFTGISPSYTRGVVDTYTPEWLCNNNFNLQQITSFTNRYAISPFIAALTGARVIPTIELCSILGFSKERLTALVTAVRRKHIKFCFVGAGGTGVNTAYWLSEIQALTGFSNTFSYVKVFEEDDVEISNLFRFPINPFTQITTDIRKTSVIYPLTQYLCNGHTEVIHKLLPYTGDNDTLVYHHSVYNDHLKPERGFAHSNTVLYGAPSLESRAQLSPYGKFICATHADSSCSMWLNPSQDLDIQQESYGKIQLNSFFMNQLKMAITLLEILASDQDLSVQDKSLLEFEFTEDMAKDSIYNFPLHPQSELIT